MDPIPALSPEGPNVVELSESPGRRLRVLRQSRGWTIERVATQLHLRTPLVEALEQDRFQDLPSPVFVMGYLRNYARLLGIDPEPLINAYQALSPGRDLGSGVDATARRAPRTPRGSARTSTQPERGGGQLLVRLVSLGILIAVVGLAALWWQDRPLSETDLEGGPFGLSLPVAEGPADTETDLDLAPPEALPGPTGGGMESKPLPLTPLEEAVAGLASDPSTRAPGATEAESLPAAPSTDGMAEAPTTGATPVGTTEIPGDEAASLPPPEAVPPQVVMRFAGTSWVDVRDASGKVILTGEMRKGDERVLSGSPPYSFVIGNAKAAAVTIGERRLDLSTRGRGGVARFRLDPSNPE